MERSRRHRVADLLRAELSSLLLTEVKDPRVRLANVTEVEVTGDLQHAHIYVSVLGSDAERQACLQALDHARGFLRTQLARRLNLRQTPELRFELDRGAEHSQRIHQILEEL